MASEDVVRKSRNDRAVTTIVNLAEEAKLAQEGVKGPATRSSPSASHSSPTAWPVEWMPMALALRCAAPTLASLQGEYASIYKEEQEERSDRWKNFLERQAKSSGQDAEVALTLKKGEAAGIRLQHVVLDWKGRW